MPGGGEPMDIPTVPAVAAVPIAASFERLAAELREAARYRFDQHDFLQGDQLTAGALRLQLRARLLAREAGRC
jgi:hypothetical protein